MVMAVRFYASEQDVKNTVRKLSLQGFNSDAAYITAPGDGEPEATVKAAIAAGKLPGSHVHAATQALRKGRTVLALEMPYNGLGTLAILEEGNPVDSDLLPDKVSIKPMLVSEALGIPLLSRKKEGAFIMNSNTFITAEPEKLLSKRKTWSSMFGMPLLKNATGKTSSFGMPLLKNDTGKASSFGMALLKNEAGKTSSFGMPLLSSKKTPLSSALGLKLLKEPKRRRQG